MLTLAYKHLYRTCDVQPHSRLEAAVVFVGGMSVDVTAGDRHQACGSDLSHAVKGA
jgi:hypothetical protein